MFAFLAYDARDQLSAEQLIDNARVMVEVESKRSFGIRKFSWSLLLLLLWLFYQLIRIQLVLYLPENVPQILLRVMLLHRIEVTR